MFSFGWTNIYGPCFGPEILMPLMQVINIWLLSSRVWILFPLTPQPVQAAGFFIPTVAKLLSPPGGLLLLKFC